MQTKIKLPFYYNFTTILFGFILFFFILYIAQSILIPLAFAFIFALFLYPLCKRIERAGIPRWLAIFICIFLVLIGLFIIAVILYNNLMTFTNDLPTIKERTLDLINLGQTLLEEQLDMSSEKQLDWIKENLKEFVNTGGVLLNNILNTTTIFLTDLFLIFIYVYFMLSYRTVFKNFIHQIIDFEHLEKANIIENQIQAIIQKYVVGLISVIGIISCLNIIGLYFIGINHAIFFGVLAAALTVIPYIGIFIGSLLAITYALVMTDSLFYPIAVLIWFQIVQAFEGNFITPNIIGSQVSINPMVAILALLVGGTLWGISGMILFVPYIAMIKVFLDNIPDLAPYGYVLSEGKTKENISFKSFFALPKVFFNNKKKV